MSQHWAMSGARSNGSGVIWKLPASIFEMSRIELTTDSKCRPDELMMLAYSQRRAASSAITSAPRISEKPMMAFSGVRNS